MSKLPVRLDHTGSARFQAQKSARASSPPRYLRVPGAAVSLVPDREERPAAPVLPARWAVRPLPIASGEVLAVRHSPERGLEALVRATGASRAYWGAAAGRVTVAQVRRWMEARLLK